MSNFNIFSIGNGITFGFDTITNHSQLGVDPRYKKAKMLQSHPDNLYRTYADYVANKIDADIYYIGNGDIDTKKVSNIFYSNFHLIKKNFSDNINLHFINLSKSNVPSFLPVADEIEHLKKDPHSRDKIFKLLNKYARNYTAKTIDESTPVLKFFKQINELADYNNRVIIVTPDFDGIHYYGDNTPHNYKEFFTNEWVLFVDRDIKYVLDYNIDQKIEKSITLQEHQKLGEFVYHRLTNDSKLLTI